VNQKNKNDGGIFGNKLKLYVMEKEKCVSCGVETIFNVDTHVDFRTNYIEGVGQFCPRCYHGKQGRNMIAIPISFITETPNDSELGYKIRDFFNQNY
jgi:hypothetical protein